jgi:hypothetical protein
MALRLELHCVKAVSPRSSTNCTRYVGACIVRLRPLQALPAQSYKVNSVFDSRTPKFILATPMGYRCHVSRFPKNGELPVSPRGGPKGQASASHDTVLAWTIAPRCHPALELGARENNLLPVPSARGSRACSLQVEIAIAIRITAFQSDVAVSCSPGTASVRRCCAEMRFSPDAWPLRF